MKGNILTIMKKELKRLLGDKRILINAVLLPGILIYVMYSFMGSALAGMFTPDATPPQIAVVHMPASVSQMFDAAALSYTDIQATDVAEIERIKSQIVAKESELLLVFPADFDTLVDEFEIRNATTTAPNIALFFNSAHTNSAHVYTQVVSMLDAYEATLANKFDVNGGNEVYNLASDKDLSGQMFSSLMPLLLAILLFSGCMVIAPESIAGEKERGTLSTLLVTPLRRSELALGKIFAITIVGTLSAISSTIGTISSLPQLTGGVSDGLPLFYTTGDYLLLGVVILSTVLLFVSLMSILSAFAKSIKEAQTYMTPLMIVVTLAGITGMLGGAIEKPLAYLIPVYNSVQCMTAIFSFEAVPLHVAITLVSNLLYCGALVFILTKMFNSEKVMFSR